MRLLRAAVVFYFLGALVTSLVVLQTYLHARAEGMPREGGLTFGKLFTVVVLWPWILLLYFID